MRAAVIDVGSNSIKLLVALKGRDGRLSEVASRTIETRISMGIGSGKPQLSPEGMERGIAAIADLAAEAKGAGATKVTAVATSAVRDASNGTVFLRVLKAATGIGLRILTGPEEAGLIGRGLTTDPSLLILRNFHAYDLGGGSLECLSFTARKVERAESLQLGCVRLTEMFVPSPSGPLSNAAAREISRHVKEVFLKSGFPHPVPSGSGVIGTGGTLTTVRNMSAESRGVPIEATSPIVGVNFLHELLAKVSPMNAGARGKIPGLSPERADVFPTALVTLLAVAELGAIQAFHHSFRNLRWGVAAEILG
jgi:exopolyphosphatase/guanosine-5'-triphosphate,3'-diphosphate pyrophosphatase